MSHRAPTGISCATHHNMLHIAYHIRISIVHMICIIDITHIICVIDIMHIICITCIIDIIQVT